MNCRSSLSPQDQLSRVFKALSHPNRLAIYLEVVNQSQPTVKNCGLSQLMSTLGIGAPTLSHHTRELVDAGLIHIQRDGRVIRCTVNEETRQQLADFFSYSLTSSLQGDHS